MLLKGLSFLLAALSGLLTQLPWPPWEKTHMCNGAEGPGSATALPLESLSLLGPQFVWWEGVQMG